MSYAIAAAICAVTAVLEALSAGQNPMAQLKATRQPAWSPPTWTWALIGVAWYGICFAALVRLLSNGAEAKAAIALLCVMMVANAAVNILQFRLRRLDYAFLFLSPYWAVLAAFLWKACPLDAVICTMFGAYAIYQVYAGVWQYQLWRLNPPGGDRR